MPVNWLEMRRIGIWLCVAFITLVTLSNLPRIAVAQQTPWIEPAKTKQYVNNLLSWYNFWADSLPASARPYLTLYHGLGFNFRVYVIPANPNNDTLASFLFSPIQANDPQVIIDSNVSLVGLTNFHIKGDNVTLKAFTIIISNTTLPVHLIYTTLTSKVLTNTLANSEAVARYLYRLDKQSIPTPPWWSGLADWLWNTVSQFWEVFLIVGAIIGTWASVVYLQEKGRLPHFRKDSSRPNQSRLGKH